MIRKLSVVGVTVVICLLGVTSVLAVEYNEAPMLRLKVAAGELPPVEQRLPEEPLVVEPFEEIGQYGGMVRSARIGTDRYGFYRIAYEPLFQWDKDHTEIQPNVVASWEVSEDKKVYTFHLRRGMKWSDGVPFTADDIVFWNEDMLLNEEITPRIWYAWKPYDEPVRVKKIDDFTVQFRFVGPYGQMFATFLAGEEPYAPKHYLKQFHPRYTSEEKLEEMANDEGFENWVQLFLHKNRFNGQTPERPTLRAWMDVIGMEETFHITERNPYYWKVDTEGNQLPYIDEWRRETVSSTEIIKLKIMAGEIDFQSREIYGVSNFPLLAVHQKDGNYTVLQRGGAGASGFGFYPNQNYKEDSVVGELFRNKKFRIALSLGIDRKKISNLVFMGMVEPAQGLGGQVGFPDYDESADKIYTEYDPERANELLDEIGLTERNKEGIRLRPDKKPLTLIMDWYSTDRSQTTIVEIVKSNWAEIGVGLLIKPTEKTIFSVRLSTNKIQFRTKSILPLEIFGHNLQVSTAWAPLWHAWLTSSGEEGEEPPQDVKRIWEIFTEEAPKADSTESIQLKKELYAIWSDNLWYFGLFRPPFVPVIFKNNLGNVAETAVMTSPNHPNIEAPWQWFWKK